MICAGRALIDDAPSGSVMALPLSHGQATFGILAINHPLPGHFSSQDLLLFEGVAAQTGVALSAARWEPEQIGGSADQAMSEQDRQIPAQPRSHAYHFRSSAGWPGADRYHRAHPDRKRRLLRRCAWHPAARGDRAGSTQRSFKS